MPYTVHNFQSGDILLADDLNSMDRQIASLTEEVEAGGAYTIIEDTTGIEIVNNG